MQLIHPTAMLWDEPGGKFFFPLLSHFLSFLSASAFQWMGKRQEGGKIGKEREKTHLPDAKMC